MSFREIRKARTFAKQAHKDVGQTRKGSGDNYVTHLDGVARRIYEAGGDVKQIQAAYLHDTVEDTGITLGDIAEHFGAEVAHLVFYTSEVSRPEDGVRAIRKTLDREHYSCGPPRSQSIKLADMLDNLSNLTTLKPSFARIYLEEKRDLAKALKLGDQQMRSEALDLIDRQSVMLNKEKGHKPDQAVSKPARSMAL